MDRYKEHNKVLGKRFLLENANKPSVHMLPSGLQYKVVRAGTGLKCETINPNTVWLKYRGTFIDSREFDSSDKFGGSVGIRIRNCDATKDLVRTLPRINFDFRY
jgi:FKBP-type peptidyl-prolyl cis-trans isomerase FklB